MGKESKITKPDYDHDDMIILIMSDIQPRTQGDMRFKGNC